MPRQLPPLRVVRIIHAERRRRGQDAGLPDTRGTTRDLGATTVIRRDGVQIHRGTRSAIAGTR